MTKTLRTFFISTALVLSASLAQAGTELHFQSGTIDPLKAKSILANETQSAKEYVIQFNHIITEEDKAQLRRQGYKIYRYIPENALLVKAPAVQIAKSALSGVRALLPYRAPFKISQNIGSLSVFSTLQSELLLISAFSREDAQQVAQTLSRKSSVRVHEVDGETVVVSAPLSLVPQIATLSGIEFVQKYLPMQPFILNLGTQSIPPGVPNPKGDYSDLTGYESGHKVAGFESAWAQNLCGEGQVAGMADTGLDTGSLSSLHADFKGSVIGGIAAGIGSKSWEDPMGHGTHVAGSIVGAGVASKGKVRGGAYCAKFVATGLWSPIVDNMVPPIKNGTMTKIFLDSYDLGARIHSNSWGSPQDLGAYDKNAAQVDQFMWDHPDFLLIFAAGNSGVDTDKNGVIDPGSVCSPSTGKNVLTVGASENLEAKGGIQRPIKELRGGKNDWQAEPIASSKLSDNPQGLAMFSSRGPTKDGRIKPDIVAPGTNILSNMTQNFRHSADEAPNTPPLWGLYNDDYVWAGGTSMATPITASGAIIAREVLMKRYGQTQPSAALVKAFLIHTAKDLYPGQFGEGSATQEIKTRRPNNEEGYGRLDMQMLATAQNISVLDDSKGLAAGESFRKVVSVAAGGTLLVHLTYTDSPATPAAGKALVNDLDLQVLGAQGTVFSSNDRLNNTEMAELKNLPAGNYEIVVKGTNVPMGRAGKQAFALVYSIHQ